MRALIAVLAGDGVGPEVVAEGVRALRAVGRRWGHTFELEEALVGGAAIAASGVPLPRETMDLCRRADAVLFGAVGGPEWDDPGAGVRPEQALFALRKGLGLFANLRPVVPIPSLSGASPLRSDVVRDVDLLVVRELTGGIYFGEKQRDASRAADQCAYTVPEIERIVRVAGHAARRRRGKVTSVDKANVLETSRLWRAVATRVMRDEFPDLRLEHLLVDACAMHLLRRPSDFDVIVTENLFGDILTDEASMLAGSMGMLPSASLGEGRLGLYEPIHGTAPDIAGKGVANPLATILSVGMLLRHSLGLEREARSIEVAVASAVESGVLTADVAPRGSRAATTAEVGEAVVCTLGASCAP